MSSVSSNPPPTDRLAKKVRKPYTITKSRESWTEEEHDKFLEALQLFDRDWKKIEDFVASKTVIQIRSHAQKYFMKVQKNGTVAHVPPPRPKRKASHPYPQKAPKNVLVPLQSSVAYASASVNPLTPGYPLTLVKHPSDGPITSEMECDLLVADVDAGAKGTARLSSCSISDYESPPSARTSSELAKQGLMLHGLPDFAEVYSFIGNVFDPDTKDHVEKLKEMDPINFETVMVSTEFCCLKISVILEDVFSSLLQSGR